MSAETPRRVLVVTTTRADYGLLRPLMRALDRANRTDASLLVTGTHHSASHGTTTREIAVDGFPIGEMIDLSIVGDSPVELSRVSGELVTRVGECLQRLAPDVVVILGDRFELIPIALACTISAVPLAHIHGGEITEGAFDDSVRHALTKLAHLHFPATERFARRIEQLGEESSRVHVAGALGIDALREAQLLSASDLWKALGWEPLPLGFVLATYHPETAGDDSLKGLEAMLAALEEHSDLSVLMTGTNADPGSRAIADRCEQWAAQAGARALLVQSLGHQRYLSAMRLASAVVGNSSSGIIEAPSTGTPTVNIGQRQQGRPRADSVIDCDPDPQQISDAIRAAMALAEERHHQPFENPYGTGKASEVIASILGSAELSLRKRFVDRDGPA